ncbi:hypothetical protein FOCG_06213 [Fusarium oxysporum f. sp. radicis-lycopersici 26381]|nr:hypothetical protein FOCG_06213 [Fusarium oxysporum f. sp. radicis-lycopersici 26381]
MLKAAPEGQDRWFQGNQPLRNASATRCAGVWYGMTAHAIRYAYVE